MIVFLGSLFVTRLEEINLIQESAISYSTLCMLHSDVSHSFERVTLVQDITFLLPGISVLCSTTYICDYSILQQSSTIILQVKGLNEKCPNPRVV